MQDVVVLGWRPRHGFGTVSRTQPLLCASPEEYPWSSYPVLLGLATRPAWLTVDCVLARFGRDYERARLRLRAFVEEGLQERPLPVGGMYFANDDFIRDATATLEPIPEIPRRQWQPLRPGLSEIFAAGGDPLVVAYRSWGYTQQEIAAYLGCHYSTVSRRLRKSEGA